MSRPRIIALDTETTGLDPRTEEIFEIAVQDVYAPTREAVWCPKPSDDAVRLMHPTAAKVNMFHERTSAVTWSWDNPLTVCEELHAWLDGAHVVGAVPSFDMNFIKEFYARNGQEAPRWNYHLIDVEAMALGYLTARNGLPPTVPFKSTELSRECGIEPPSGEDRHTALGDTRWVADWYRRMAGIRVGR